MKRVLVPRRGQPVRRQRGGQRAAGDEAEVARAGAARRARVDARDELVDHLLGRRRPRRPAASPSAARSASGSTGDADRPLGQRGEVRLGVARDAFEHERQSPTLEAVHAAPEKLLLAAPRGYCAGVDRAVQTVERALELHGAPVYVRKEIVHNKHVVETLRERGAIFVDELDDSIPEGAITVFSAHGVSPAVHADAERRQLRTIDATCPLVTKVHREALKFAAEGYTIVLIGHAGHEEVEGTMGEAPDHIVLVETEADVDTLEVEDERKLAYISPDHAVGRRDAHDHRPPARALPAHHRAAHRRHLLRHHEPPGRGQADGRALRPRARDRLHELVQLQPAGRRRPRPRRARAPDRRCRPGAGGVARGRPRRRHLLGRERARGAGRGPRGLLPRPRDHGHRGVRGPARGRPVHAAEADPAGD